MTARDDFDRHLAAWLAAAAPTSEPEPLLGQVLARTARTRRRPGWLIPERWTLVSVITSRSATMSRVPWRAVGLAALLILAIALGAVLVAGTRRPTVPAPFGIAANGALFYSANGELLAADGPTGTTRTVLGGSTDDSGPLVSPDGTRIAFIRGGVGTPDAQLWLAGVDGSSPRKLADVPAVGWVEWAPGGDTLAVTLDGGGRSSTWSRPTAAPRPSSGRISRRSRIRSGAHPTAPS